MGLFETSGIWIIALGKTLTHSIWIGLLILGMMRLTLSHIPTRLSALRYSISVSALLLLCFSVLGTFILIYKPLATSLEMLAVSGSYRHEMIFESSLLYRLFGYIYFAGVLIMTSRSYASLAYVRGLRKSSIRLAPEWQLRFMKISKSLGIRRSVEFLASTCVKAPFLVGYLKPAVIVPAGMLSNLPVSQIETILLHELYHLKRKDYLVNILQLLIEAILFYHPVVWIISGSVRREREHCCDDCVLNRTDNPISYAKALIHLAEQQHFTRLAPGAVGSRKKQFESRIKRILNYNSMKTNMRDKILSLTLLAGSLLLLLTVSGFSAGPSIIRARNMSSELAAESTGPVELFKPDTIPQKKNAVEFEEPEKADVFEWEEMKKEIKEARIEALKEIEEIDWDAMKEELEEAHLEAMKEIEEIDWDAMKKEMELSIAEMKIDMENIKIEIENSMNEIDWDKIREDIREDIENSRVLLDSIKFDMDW
jgi:beta-lactamase regulating signal transducer with metallopeptidase domain